MRGSGFFPQKGWWLGCQTCDLILFSRGGSPRPILGYFTRNWITFSRGGGRTTWPPLDPRMYRYSGLSGLLKLFLSLFSVHWFRCLWIPCGVHQHRFSLYSKTRLSRPVLVSKRWISSDVQDGLASIEAMLHPFQNVLLRRKWSDFPLITTHRQRRVYDWKQ